MVEAATIDYSRPPLGELSASKLIAEVAEIGDLAERHYLEVKGVHFDISSKKDKHKIAKFILGAANRDPAIAERYFQGYAVMILGVDKGNIAGVEPTEMMELQKVIRPFLGASGPKWDVVRVPVDDSEKEVLVILVDPPKFGQPPFPCRADGEGLKNGAIYIRDDGDTREAKADEIDMLLHRAQRNSSEVNLVVSLEGKATPFHCDREQTLDAFIDDTESSLFAALPDQSPSSSTSSLLSPYSALLSAAMVDPLTKPEDRTREEYLAEIEEWKTQCEKSWDKLFNNTIALFDSSEICIENTTTKYLTQVEVQIHLPGRVFMIPHKVIESVKNVGPSDLGLPDSPRPWGPKRTDYSFLSPALRSIDPRALNFTPSNATWRNTGSVDITVDVGDLRPKATFTTKDDYAVLAVPEDFSDKAITGTWTATVKGVDELFTGELTVPVAPVLDVTRGVRVLLGLEEMPDDKNEQGE